MDQGKKQNYNVFSKYSQNSFQFLCYTVTKERLIGLIVKASLDAETILVVVKQFVMVQNGFH